MTSAGQQLHLLSTDRGELIGGRNYLYGIAVLLSLSHGRLTHGSVDSSLRA